jgi:hypothetical protein
VIAPPADCGEYSAAYHLHSFINDRVRYRQLRGILREFDECEEGGPRFASGKRELTAEWIVDKKVWTDWQKTWKGRRKEKTTDKMKGERVVLYLHGSKHPPIACQPLGEA